MKALTIYVAGPYTAGTPEQVEANVAAATAAGLALFRKGHYPYVPHLSHHLHLLALAEGEEIPYEVWMQLGFAFLDRCDALLFLRKSPGASRELTRAFLAKKPVFYRVGDIPAAVGV